MATDFNASSVAIPRWKWYLVFLMFLATVINYMDRQVLGSVQKPFMAEFGLNKEQFGWIEFAFGMTFGITQLFAGALADRVSIRWLYGASLLLWSLAGMMCGLVTTLPLFILCRMVLGFGESFNWPCAVGAVRRVIPPDSRSYANGLFHGGSSIGAILTPLVVLAMVGPEPDFANWRLVFVVVGGVGMLWVIAWFWFLRGERAVEVDTHSQEAVDNPESLLDVLRERRVWLAILIGMFVNLCWHFFRYWLPIILDSDYHFDQRTIQWLLAGYYLCADLGGIAAGFATRILMRRGWSDVTARQFVMFATASLCLVAVPAALWASPLVAVGLFFVVGFGAMGGFPNYFALAQATSARHTAQVLGFSGAASWCGYAALNPIVGRYRDTHADFVPIIVIAGCLPLVGAILGLAWPKTGTPRK